MIAFNVNFNVLMINLVKKTDGFIAGFSKYKFTRETGWGYFKVIVGWRASQERQRTSKPVEEYKLFALTE